MKKSIYILLILISSNILAQDPQLIDTPWYLRNVVISSNDNFPTTTATLFFQNNDPDYSISLAMCQNFLSNAVFFESTNSTFSVLTGGWIDGGFDCGNPDDINYESLYYGFYIDNETTPFTYEITPDGGDLSLVVTAQNGDRAIYGNTVLGTNDLNGSSFSIYPNPTAEILTIDFSETTFNSTEYLIFNSRGKAVVRADISGLNSHTIAVENLSAGIYFITIKTKDGTQFTKRFVKK
ncbi:T9SS type A sorting domain-containing protein [Patiriisocius sp. Uisw_017]|jgi:hypothetical protein|uniref:T9SS type A sorting domain-containing protein n=1 Tax=Patiriisocius sp. Uisw_017 TaxID=3230968 RepID=UPI0039EAB304